MRTWWRSRARRGPKRPGRKPLSCQELVELVTDYLEDALDNETLARFEEHIAGCDGCTEYVEQMRQTIRIVGSLDEKRLSEPARSKLMDAFRDWKRPPS
ncbi:MAG TPA: zf-HC2 domain-containing protein [Acidimicrobiales bacterium]|nr:zf-HC2 domain-containing protein [Acidimicrobiales bacterium]